jgi:hypothetical protein
MQTDQNLVFDGLNGVPHVIAGSANVASTGTLDLAEGLMLTGGTYDNPAPNFKISPALNGIWGEDLGIGPLRLFNRAFVGAAFIGGGATLNVAYQGAVDNLGGTIAGLTFVTFAETGPYLTAALLTANAKIPLPDFSHRALAVLGAGGGMPRFIRYLWQITGTFTQGSIAFAGLLMPSNDNPVGNYGSGFVVAP